MEWKEIFTVSLATAGTVLGVINTAVQLNTRRVRLRVTPRSAEVVSWGVLSNKLDHVPGNTPCVEVVNLSTFPVTIKLVGYTLPGKNRATIPRPIILDSKPWPRRLESRESVTIYANGEELPPTIERAFAETDCGEVRYGTSGALKAYLRQQRG